MFKSVMIDIFTEIWPMIFIFSVVLVLLRAVYLLKTKESFLLYKEFMILSFMIYTMCLFHVVTFQDVAWWGSSNFIPFKEMFRYDIGSSMFYRNVVGNMIMFMPYGFFVAYYLRLKKSWVVLLMTLGVSVTIETIQLMIGRVFDVDDIVLNVIGGFLGYLIYRIVKWITTLVPKGINRHILYNTIMLMVITFVILYLSSIINLGV